MTLRTVTYDDSKFKIVPIEPTYDQLAAMREIERGNNWSESMEAAYKAAIAAAPEYQESEQIPVAIGEVQHYAAPANLPAYVNAKWYGNPPKNGAKVYALPPAPDGDKP